MKKILLLSLIAFSAKAELYTVDPMICKGKLIGDTTQVHTSYTKLLQKFESFQSTRRDGTLANSLEVSNSYASPGERLDVSTASWGEVWQMGPLSLKGKNVVRKDLSGRGDDLALTITGTKTVNGKRVDTLKGTWMNPNSVAGSYGYQLECQATVVKTPSRRDDCRRGCSI